MLSVPYIRKRFILFCTDRLTWTTPHSRLGVQGEQLHCIEPPVGWRTFSPGFTYCSKTLPSSAQDYTGVTLARQESAKDFFAVTLALEESNSELLDVTLAWEDDHLGVPDQTEDASFLIRFISTWK